MCGSWTQGVSRQIFDDTIVVVGGGDSLRKVLVVESCWIQDLLLKFFAFSAFSTATPPPTPTVATTPMRMRNLRGLDASIFFFLGKFQPTWLAYWLGVRLGPSSSFIQEWWSIYSNYENLRTWMEQVVCQNHWSSRSLRVDLSFNTIR